MNQIKTKLNDISDFLFFSRNKSLNLTYIKKRNNKHMNSVKKLKIM